MKIYHFKMYICNITDIHRDDRTQYHTRDKKGVCFNGLSPDKLCENLFQKCHQQNDVLGYLYDTSDEELLFEQIIQYIEHFKATSEEWGQEIKTHQEKMPFGRILNSANYYHSFSLIFTAIDLSPFSG